MQGIRSRGADDGRSKPGARVPFPGRRSPGAARSVALTHFIRPAPDTFRRRTGIVPSLIAPKDNGLPHTS